MTTTHTITSAKGSYTGTIEDVCAWQAQMQAAYAAIDGVDVDAIDFDAEDLGPSIAAVSEAVAAPVREDDAVEAGDTEDDYDQGTVLAVRWTPSGVEAEVGWASGSRTWQRADMLRRA